MPELNRFEQTSNFFGRFFKGQQRAEKLQKKATVFDKKVAGLLNNILVDVKQELADISAVNKQGFNKIQSFADYEQVLKDMEPLLKKVVDPSIEVSTEEGEVLKEFLNKQDSLLEDMNKRLRSDKDLQEQLLKTQKSSGVELRKISYLNNEMNDFAKENGLSVGKLLDTVSSRMGVISTSLGQEATQALGSALLGPLFDIGKSVVDIGALKDLFMKSVEKQDEQSKDEKIGQLIEKKNLGIQLEQLKVNKNIQESLDDQSQMLNEQFEDLEDSIGKGDGGDGLLGGLLGLLGLSKLGKLGKIGSLIATPLLALFGLFKKLPGLGLIMKIVPKLATFGKFLGIFGLVVTVISGLIGGIKGFLDVKDIFGDQPSIGQMVSATLGGIISGITFGFLDTETIAKSIQDFGVWLGDTIGSVFTWIKDKISMVFDAITSLFSKLDISSRIKSFFGFGESKEIEKPVRITPIHRPKTVTTKVAELSTAIAEGSTRKRLREQESIKTIVKEVVKERQAPQPDRIQRRGLVSTPTLRSIPVIVDNFGLILINSGMI
jgi:hypothetical protein